jgi:hypothetical protein
MDGQSVGASHNTPTLHSHILPTLLYHDPLPLLPSHLIPISIIPARRAGPGVGNQGIMSEKAMKYVYDRLGRKNTKATGWKAMTLCFSSKSHGFSASGFHSRCNGKGPVLLVARMKTGRVFVRCSSVSVLHFCAQGAVGSHICRWSLTPSMRVI